MDTVKTISSKWDAAHKVAGLPNEVTLPNGEVMCGRYVLCDSGAATPSHNPLRGFEKNAGFPVDGSGQSVNDRDYERDKDAQDITRNIAARYDSRAIQSPVIVSCDGVVLSGNGRTMAGELAAVNGTDGAYIAYISKYPQQFGFTPEQVRTFEHPRVLFLLDDVLPYNAATFAKFNAQEMNGAEQNGTKRSNRTRRRTVESISVQQDGNACGGDSGNRRKPRRKRKPKEVEAAPQYEDLDAQVAAILAEYRDCCDDDDEEEEEKEPEQETAVSILRKKYPHFWTFMLVYVVVYLFLIIWLARFTDLDSFSAGQIIAIVSGVFYGLYKGFCIKEEKNVASGGSGYTLEKIMGAICGFFIINSLKGKK